ncbi:MAG TPA: carboxypeptidase M32 [Actinomycetota bacterium]|nr:carboxypeptidase M32 [Actinomycetota bacterium]
MSEAWERLLPRINELEDISSALRLLNWDQQVMMPPKAAAARARSVATLGAIAHQRLCDPEVGALLDELSEADSLDEIQTASVRVLKRDYERATKIPEKLVRELAETSAIAYQTWTEARPADDFGMLEPHLTKLVALKKEEADSIGWSQERYDALLDEYEPEMTTKEVEQVFSELVAGLVPLADRVLPAVDERPDFVHATYETGPQNDFSQWLVEVLGFAKESGRLDTSPHPFTIPISVGDVRQTTRLDERDLLFSITGTMHETGHALYEQGIPEEMLGLPAGRVPSLGLHESQSRLWENQVGRSRAFTDFMLPHLKERFSDQLGLVTPEEFHRAMNHPERSLIRVIADELTYNLHIAFRFELETAIFRDELDVADLPGAWDEAMEKTVGIRPTDTKDGVLQDVHWSIGALGYFPTYTLGNLYAAALWAKATEQLPGLEEDLRRGDGSRLLTWLREKIHSRGYLESAKETAERVLGEPLTAQPLLKYLETKYSEIYDVAS